MKIILPYFLAFVTLFGLGYMAQDLGLGLILMLFGALSLALFVVRQTRIESELKAKKEIEAKYKWYSDPKNRYNGQSLR